MLFVVMIINVSGLCFCFNNVAMDCLIDASRQFILDFLLILKGNALMIGPLCSMYLLFYKHIEG